MARRTIGSVSPVMHVVIDVTGIAIVAAQAREILGAMTILTVQTAVPVCQGKSGFPRMVERHLRPICRYVTVCTPGTVSTFMHIVVAMAGHAFGWCRRIVLRDVAGVTARRLMPPG